LALNPVVGFTIGLKVVTLVPSPPPQPSAGKRTWRSHNNCKKAKALLDHDDAAHYINFSEGNGM